MATTIQIKRSTGTSAPSSLAAGELAITFGTGTQSNLGDRLFIGDGSTVDVIGGKFFSDMLDHVQGTLTAGSAITVDGNKAVDDLIIGNNATTGGSINMAGWMSFSGSDVVNSATASQTASADTPVTRVTLSTGTSNTLNLPTTDVYQGQIKYIVCNVESGVGTLALQTTNRVPTTSMSFQDIGDSVTLMWDATASKWIVLGVIGMTTTLA